MTNPDKREELFRLQQQLTNRLGAEDVCSSSVKSAWETGAGKEG